MNCSKCGNQIKEGCAFCGVCGTPVTSAETPPAPTPTPIPAPVVAPQPQPIQQPVSTPTQKVVGKNRYFFTVAPIKVKLISITSIVLALLCISMLAMSTTQLMDTPIDEVTIVDLAFEYTGFDGEYRSLMNDLKSATKDLEEYEPVSDEISNKDLRKLRTLTNDLLEFKREPTITNAKYALESYYELNISDFEDEALYWLDELAEPVESSLPLVEIGIYTLLAIPVILLLIGFLIKNGALAITGAIFALLYAICFSQTTLLILTVLSVILAVVLLIISNKNYKKYKRNF